MVYAISTKEKKVIFRHVEKSTKLLHTVHKDPTVERKQHFGSVSSSSVNGREFAEHLITAD